MPRKMSTSETQTTGVCFAGPRAWGSSLYKAKEMTKDQVWVIVSKVPREMRTCSKVEREGEAVGQALAGRSRKNRRKRRGRRTTLRDRSLVGSIEVTWGRRKLKSLSWGADRSRPEPITWITAQSNPNKNLTFHEGTCKALQFISTTIAWNMSNTI